MKPMIFVGECRSLTAIRKGWTWKDGRLAAKPLFEALEAMGVDPDTQEFCNLWTDPPLAQCITNHRKQALRMKLSEGYTIVALGSRVSEALAELDIDHVGIVHPAARGRIRKRERYIAHVAEKLASTLPKVLRIQSTHDEPGASWIERYFLLDKRGVPHELRRIPGNGQYAPGNGEILAWFRSLGVTHVDVADGWHDSVPPKRYALATFSRHLRRVSAEAES